MLLTFYFFVKWPAEWRAAWEAREARKKAREEQAIKGFDSGCSDDDDGCDSSSAQEEEEKEEEEEALAKRRESKQAAKASRVAALAEAGMELAKARAQQRLLPVNAEAITQTIEKKNLLESTCTGLYPQYSHLFFSFLFCAHHPIALKGDSDHSTGAGA
jgi:hypothetical protein